eukprot:4129055-Pyramimonas_sp.AAC.1
MTRGPGTPVAETLTRDVRRRLFSPLHEMDDDLDLSPPRPEVHQISSPMAPGTPEEAAAQPPTLQQIANLLKQEVQPLRKAVEGLERKVTEIGGTMEERMTEVESKMENMDARLTHLETSSAGSRTDAEVREQLKMLEAQISELKLMDNTQKSNGNQYE